MRQSGQQRRHLTDLANEGAVLGLRYIGKAVNFGDSINCPASPLRGSCQLSADRRSFEAPVRDWKVVRAAGDDDEALPGGQLLGSDPAGGGCPSPCRGAARLSRGLDQPRGACGPGGQLLDLRRELDAEFVVGNLVEVRAVDRPNLIAKSGAVSWGAIGVPRMDSRC